MRKVLMFIVTIGLLISILPLSGVAAATEFSDIANHWAKSGIHNAVEKGYVSGYPDGKFQPNNQVTRAEFIKMVVDALEVPLAQGATPWYQPYVEAAIESELLTNMDSTEYSKPISRIEIMRIVSRGLAREDKYKVYIDTFSGLYNGDLPFTDYRDFEQEDLPSIALAFGAGIINGYPDMTMGLQKSATRAEAIVMIENLLSVRGIDPANKIRIQELKEVAETGMNVTTLSTLVPLINLQTENVNVEHKNFSAKLKRLYVIPFEGDKMSIFEDKFIGGRKNLEAAEPIYVQDKRGYIIAVAEVIFKVDGTQKAYSSHMYLSGTGSLFYYQEPRKKFGYQISYPDEYSNYKKNQKVEAVMYISYQNMDVNIKLQTNDALKGGHHTLLKNFDALGGKH